MAVVAVVCLLTACGRFSIELVPPDDAMVGGCALGCENVHGTAECVDGACQLTCAIGYADCDHDAANGCETNVAESLQSCGDCARSCANAHGALACTLGVCTPVCDAGFGDCDQDPTNGCESDLSSDERCGGCAVRCTNAHGTTSCAAGTCVPGCTAGYADCDGDRTNGCEADVANDPAQCGGCGMACGSDSQICVEGACQTSSCEPGRAECDGNIEPACETDIASSESHCGFCGNACLPAHATPECLAATCRVGSCGPGYADCDGSATNGCEVALSASGTHCGACGTVCTNAHGATSCVGAVCAPSCSTGFGDCDGSRQNGCETSLATVSDCGACGRSCPANGGTASCNAGVCATTCDLSGTFALKLTLQASWPANAAIAAGSGTFSFWLRVQVSPGTAATPLTIAECARIAPDVRAASVNETFALSFPNTLFDRVPAYLPSAMALGSLSGASPGGGYSIPAFALQAGVALADPINGAWPPVASGLTPIDMDGDGKLGLSAIFKSGGVYSFPPTSIAATFNRADRAYFASRLALSLNGTLSSCTAGSGAATFTRLDVHILGCNVAGRTQDCSAGEQDFLDRGLPSYQLGTATHALRKVSNDATCAAIRAALP